MSASLALRAGDYKLAANVMRELSVATDFQEFRLKLFLGVSELFPGAILTLNALGQPDNSIYCIREGEEVHNTYAAEMPELWPAQRILLDFPPVTERGYATTLGRQKGSPMEADMSACREFYSKLKVDDAAALLLNHGHEYLGLFCVNTLGLSDKDKSRLEDFLEFIGPAVSRHYSTVTHRGIYSDICSNLAKTFEKSGHGAMILDRHGRLHAASESVMTCLLKLGRTERDSFRDSCSAWLRSQLSLRGRKAPNALTWRTSLGPMTLTYIKPFGLTGTDLAWYLVDVTLPLTTHHGQRPMRLTRRELEVAECVANGFGDAEIGAKLFISTFTVKRHICNMLTKLGGNSRSTIALWYMRETAATA